MERDTEAGVNVKNKLRKNQEINSLKIKITLKLFKTKTHTDLVRLMKKTEGVT